MKGFEEKVMEALEREGKPENKTFKSVVAGDGAGDGLVDGDVATNVAVEEQSRTTEGLTSESFAKAVDLDEQNETEPTAISATNATNFPASSTKTLDFIVKRIRDLFSDRQIAVRQMDLTTAAIKGAAAGAAFTGLLFLLLRPR